MEKNMQKGFLFKKYEAPFQSPFDKLFEIFKELITHTSGDFEEAIDWLRQLDVEYKLTDSSYTIDDFIEDLKKITETPIILIDERMSTVSASRSLREAGLDSKKSKSIIDMAAAVAILEFAITIEKGKS